MRNQLLKNFSISFLVSFLVVSISFAQPASVELKIVLEFLLAHTQASKKLIMQYPQLYLKLISLRF